MNSPATEQPTLRLEGALEVSTAAALWPLLRTQVGGITRIDLSAVTAIDSSGVALIRCLQTLAATQGRRPEIVAAPPRFAQICLAHRVAADGN